MNFEIFFYFKTKSFNIYVGENLSSKKEKNWILNSSKY